jgi:hypothetical protein
LQGSCNEEEGRWDEAMKPVIRTRGHRRYGGRYGGQRGTTAREQRGAHASEASGLDSNRPQPAESGSLYTYNNVSIL